VIVLQGPRQRLDGVVLSPDGRYAACGGGTESFLVLWDVADGRQIQLNPMMGYYFRNSFTFSGDGRFLVASYPSIVRVYDASTGRVTGEASTKGKIIWALRSHPDGRLLSSASQHVHPQWQKLSTDDNLFWFDSDLQLFSTNGFRTGDRITHALAFAADGNTLVTRGSEGLSAWDVQNAEHLGHWPIEDHDRTSLTVSPNGRFAAFPHRSRLHVVDLSGQDGGTVISHAPRKRFQGAAFTPDGRHLAVVGGADTVRFWDTATWQERQAFDWGVGELRGVAFTADGLRGVAVSAKGHVVIWDQDF
jgi:WD40 repeat protein